MSGRLRKNKNIVRNRKAFSSIVGAIFAILVIVSLTGTFFVWSLEENSQYVNAVSNVNELALLQKSESLNVTGDPNYTVAVGGGSVTVLAGIQNDGPISVNVTTLWVQDLSATRPFGYTMVNGTGLLISPGDTWMMPIVVPVPGAVPSDNNFTSWLITARGNVVPLYPAHAKGQAGAAGVSGTNGTMWYVGQDVPGAGLGSTGDFFFSDNTDCIYNKNPAWTLIANLTGPAGATGTNGANGTTWYTGTSSPPLNSMGVDGDFYLNTATYDVYKKSGGAWGFLVNIKGAQGTQGTQGTNGSTWYTGTSSPPLNSMGVDGDFYLNTATYDVYKKSGGVWGFLVNIKGAQGNNGTMWYVGLDIPSPSLGVTGDFYFSENTYCIYNKNPTWTLIANLSLAGGGGTNGTNGTAWYTGATNPSNSIGVNGDFYLNTATYDVFRKSSGVWSFLVNIKGAPGNTSYDANTALVSQGIGSVAMNFSEFRLYDFGSSSMPNGTLLTSGLESKSYTIQNTHYYAIRVALIMEDGRWANISLNSISYIWGLTPQAATLKSCSWPMLRLGSDGKLYTGNFAQDLQFNKTAYVYFGITATGFSGSVCPVVIPINILLFGFSVYANSTFAQYGQNLPFIALNVPS